MEKTNRAFSLINQNLLIQALEDIGNIEKSTKIKEKFEEIYKQFLINVEASEAM